MKKMKLDFSGVSQEIGARGRHIDPGDYECKIVSVARKYKDNDETNVPYLSWKFEVRKGPEKGAPLYYITSLKTEALWNLRNLIFAATNKNVAGKALNFDPDNLIGKILMVTVEDDEYKGKITSRAVDVQPLKGKDEEEDEEEYEEEEEEDLEDVDLDEV